MTLLYRLRLATLLQLLAPVLADGLKHTEAWLSIDGHVGEQALVSQQFEHLRRVVVCCALYVAHSLRRFERAAANKHGQPPEQPGLALAQQAVAPFDGSAQSPLTGRAVQRAAHQQREAVPQPLQHRVRRERLNAGGGKLYRQRQSIQPGANLGYRLSVVGRQLEVRVGRLRSLDEQRYRGVFRKRIYRNVLGEIG